MNRKLTGFLAALALCAAPAPLTPTSAHAQACQTATLTTSAGQLCGVTDTTRNRQQQPASVSVYKGIPYARMPVGANRWKAPQDTTWPGVLRATNFGPICPQGEKSATAPQPESEGCLFLNVWVPGGATSSSTVPVMVFIHGGAFVMGSGSSGLYDGRYLAAAGNVVVVTLNYRLGALGFLYHNNDDHQIGGNFGLLDQQQALRWVRDNVGAFGGDPARVTVFGESAGAMSVGLHLFATPSSQGLFRAAIMESNPMGVQYRDPAAAQTDGARFVEILCGLAAVRCKEDPKSWLQAVDTSHIRQASEAFEAEGWGRIKNRGLPEGLPWTPLVDGTTVVGQPFNGYAPAVTRRLPIVFGTNRDEGVVFASMASKGLISKVVFNQARYDTVLVRVFGESNAGTIGAYSPAGSTAHPYAVAGHALNPPLDAAASALAQLLTDFAFDCANLAAADSAAKQNGTAVPVYGYHFEQLPFFNLYSGTDACLPGMKHVCHAYELPYVFNTLGYAGSQPGSSASTQADRTLAQALPLAWAAFATNPTSSPALNWTAYTAGSPGVYTLGGLKTGQMNTELTKSANCSLWKTMPPFAAVQ